MAANLSFKISTGASLGAGLFQFLFWVWGFFGGLYVGLYTIQIVLRVEGGVGVGIGSSGYLSALSLVWIGGMIFFGLGSILIARPLDGSGAIEQRPDYRSAEH